MVARICGRLGQVTRLVSARTSSRNVLVCCGQVRKADQNPPPGALGFRSRPITVLAAFVSFINSGLPGPPSLGRPSLQGTTGRGGGIRTPTSGFGDRRSAVKPTPLFLRLRGHGLFFTSPHALPAIRSGNSWFPCLLLHLAVDGVVPARPAKFLEFQPGSRLFFVLGGCVIPVLAVGTL